MPKLVNARPHRAYVDVDGADKPLRRYSAGEVVNATGAVAEKLADAGFISATKEHEQAWDDSRATARSGAASPSQVIADKSLAARDRQAALVAAPGQVVIGDDQAPLGPPTGTVTTKQAVRRGGSPLEQAAFGPNSAAGAEAVDAPETAEDAIAQGVELTEREVHNRQIESHEAVEEVAEELAEAREAGEPKSRTPRRSQRARSRGRKTSSRSKPSSSSSE